jgi:DNA invertase Pin-like site-specific DNA recombinase
MKRITKIGVNETLVQKKKLKVAAYCRVSTASDEQLISLEAQKAHYESYIRSNDEWEYVGLYYDEGITGTKKDVRAGLLSMIADCEDGKIEFIITKSISRFARNTTDCLEMVRKLTDLGISIYFEKENINTGSMESELMLSILSSLAESESVSISENSKWSVQKRFQNGTFIIAYPPYGYDNDNGTMVIVPEQAEVVKEIFASCLAGKGTHAIAKELNARGLKTKKNGKWGAGAVNAILTNEKYTGDVIFQKTYSDSSFNRHRNYGERDRFLCENHHEPIISREDFDRVRAVLDQRAMEKGNGTDTYRYQNRYCFSGRIKCGECGDTFKRRQHYKPSGNYVAWTCATHLENKEECSMLYISDDGIKLAFLTMMNKLVYGHQAVLKPLLRTLRGMDDKDRLLRIQELEICIEGKHRQEADSYKPYGNRSVRADSVQ